MPRKSLRTASTTYRRRQLTWDDAESVGLSLNNDDYRPVVSELTTTKKMGSGRMVTPSPGVFSASDSLEKNESTQKRPPGRKELFPKKRTLRKKSTTFKSREQASLKSRKVKIKQLSQSGVNGGSSSAGSSTTSDRKGYNRNLSRKRSLGVVSKDTESKQSPRRKVMSGDSLAAIFGFKETRKSSDSSTVVSSVSKSDCRKESQGHLRNSAGTNQKNTNICNSQSSSLRDTSTTEDEGFELIEQNNNARDYTGNEISTAKMKKPIPPELIPLLTSNTKQKSRRSTRARSTLEILNDFNKNQKRMQSKETKRARLPRACKSSKERVSLPRACKSSKDRVWEEDTDEEIESIKNNDDDSDWTESNISSEEDYQHSGENSGEEMKETCCSSTGGSSKGTDVSPPGIQARQREDQTSPIYNGAQSSSRFLSNIGNDDFKIDTNGGVSRMRQRSKSQNNDSLHQTKSRSANRRKRINDVASTSTNPGTRRRENIGESEPDSQELESVYSGQTKKRRRLSRNSNNFDAANSAVSPRIAAVGHDLSPRRRVQQLRKKPTLPVHHSPHRNLTHLFEERRETPNRKSQSHSNSPSKLVSVSNDESRSHKLNTRARKNSEISPQREKEQQLTQHRKSDNEVVTSKKRVRFDSSTTTFSVKIKIKTNRDPCSQNGTDHGQVVPFSSTLDESAVQAIANQVTQACLTQARATTGTNQGRTAGTCDDSVVNVDVDVNEEDESSSNSSSNSNQSSDDEERLMDSNRLNEVSDGIFSGRESNADGRPEESYLSRDDFDDGRSVVSELTSDWNRPRSSQFNDQECIEEPRQQNLHRPLGKGRVIPNMLAWSRRQSMDNAPQNGNGIELSHLQNGQMSPSNRMKPPRPISKSNRFGEMRSQSSVSRRQRIRSCGDSLAGSAIGSIASAVDGYDSNVIPREVSLRKRPTRLTGSRSPQRKSEKNLCASPLRGASNSSNRQKISDRKIERENDTLPDFPIIPSPPHKSRTAPFSQAHRCGKCKGCRRTFDCQTCDSCLEKLHSFGSLPPSSTQENNSICVARRCQRACRIGFVDSLLGTKSSTKQLQSAEREEAANTISTENPFLHNKSVKSPAATEAEDIRGPRDPISKNMKAPWDESDDWTVDYSYLSEPEYRRNWGQATDSDQRKVPLSSTRSLSTLSWRPPVSKTQSIGLFGTGGRTSLSSVSGSVVSQNKSKRRVIPIQSSQNSEIRARRNGKRKRDPLHGTALPRTSADACSVTSWRENRKCLRALMEYDEADQDWI